MESNEALEKIGKGSMIVFTGFLAGTVFQYLYKIILARFLGPESFGVFVLGIAIIQSATAIALLGLNESVPRFISFHRGKNELEKIRRTASTGLLITIFSSISFSLLLFVLSDTIALTVFEEAALVTPLKILAISIPALASIKFFLSLFQGQQDAVYSTLMNDFLWSGAIVLLVTGSVSLGYSVEGAAAAYLAAAFLSLPIIAYTYLRKYDHGFDFSDLNTRKLLVFSWPLFLISALSILTRWYDVLMLGWLTGSVDSGIYDVAYSIAGYGALLIEVVGFMFMPVISELYAKKNTKRIREIYDLATRWMTLTTLPVIAGMLIFPREIIQILFGSDYVGAALPLSILSLAFLFRVFKGPAEATFISMGDNRKLLAGKTVTSVLIVSLNLLLIPIYGTKGAAISTLIAFIAGDTLLLYYMRRKLGILPYDLKFLQIFVSGAIASLAVLIMEGALNPGLIGSVLLGAVLVTLYFTLLYLIGGIKRREVNKLKRVVLERLNG